MAPTPVPSDPPFLPEEGLLTVLPFDAIPDIPLLSYRNPDRSLEIPPGTRVAVPLGRRTVAGLVWSDPAPPFEGALRAISGVLDPVPVFPAALHSLVSFGAWYYRIPPGLLAKSALPPSLSLPKSLPASFWKEYGAPFEEEKAKLADLPPLSLAQIDAFREWEEKRRHPFAPFLLRGVTGSGKTRLYQEMAKTVLSEGSSVLVLTPEIGLVAPLLEAMRAISPLAEGIHSAQTKGERFRAFARILSGRVPVVVGPRSALFSPLSRLGLVIVDEEHDPSYQAYEGLSFNARNLAIRRAQDLGIPVVLGSATPLSDAIFHVSSGRYHGLSLPGRIGGRSLPAINLIHSGSGTSPLPDPVPERIAGSLDRGEQAVILLNRRGYVPTLLCRSCHATLSCPSCAVRLVFHKVPDRRLICHSCAASYAVPSLCPTCLGRDLELRGTATQKLEEILGKHFPGARIIRLDADSAQESQERLAAFREGEGDILVGTQVVAKGHDLPKVTYGVVLETDGMLAFPDYRASERAFGLILQLAGRVGRHREGGQVDIVTRDPDNPVLGWARDYNQEAFYEQTLDERRLLGYPPFSRLASVILSSAHEEPIREALAEKSPFGKFPPGNGIFGPVPALPPKLKNRYQAQIVIKAPTIGLVHNRLEQVRSYYQSRGKILVEWQIDPFDLG